MKSYRVIYNIPGDATGLAQGVKNLGKLGLNRKNQAEYDPMKSRGPGLKEY